jgi:hypothetical protein
VIYFLFSLKYFSLSLAPNNWYQELLVRWDIFLLCSVVAALSDLPHQKRIIVQELCRPRVVFGSLKEV